MSQTREHTQASLIHISALLGFLVPFGSILFPLVLWKSNNTRTEIIEKTGKSAVNFNISYSIYKMVITSILIAIFFIFDSYKNLIEIFLFLGIYVLFELATVCFIFIAAAKIQRGKAYRYPYTINFIK